MRKLLLVCSGALLALQSPAPQVALIVLDTARPPVGRLPDGWQLKVNSGQADISTSKEDNESILHLKSVKSSFSLERGLDIDPAQTPYLMWRWKVTELPNRGDFRHSSTDDEAAQVLVAFADRRVLSYIWDSTAPKGLMQSASIFPWVHVYSVVCRSGTAEANHWLMERRNVAEDYKKAYGKPAPHVKGLRLQINSQHTAAVAESYFGEVAFRDAPQ